MSVPFSLDFFLKNSFMLSVVGVAVIVLKKILNMTMTDPFLLRHRSKKDVECEEELPFSVETKK